MLRASAARLPRLSRTSAVRCRASHRALAARVARWWPTMHARVACSMALFHARPRARHRATLRKEAPLSSVLVGGRAPHVDSQWRTMACDCAEHVAAACVALRRAISMVAPPPAGRRSGESPAMS
ncbi:protein plant CADMIUM RESISTANCE 11 [Dorcoceras hygrometricum]|uniref:Protein plant CADMIUM RESISTANCE 11 n=1 Tax=Dorcoceras hygrometricum TaxID=472368 RepID=A0A2Z6ZQU8_9LAMI|nr:protein plant CADMIUM RESISTANCE 11 [Dorcoceras hygrometricum]